jgi:Kef-type K+ transport system membrane component KefB
VPFALGLGTAYLLPTDFLGEDAHRTVFALFLATALSISSLPVIAKIVSELGLTRRNFGQITIAAGMANDVVGWLLLGAIASLARSGSLDLPRLGLTVAGMALFLALMLTAGQRAVDAALRRVREREAGLHSALTVTVVAVLTAGAITQALGVEAVLGAFVAAPVIGRFALPGRARHDHPRDGDGRGLRAPVLRRGRPGVDLALLTDPSCCCGRRS